MLRLSKKENGFILPVVLVVIALLLAGGGFYYYAKVRQQKEEADSKKAIEDSILGTRAQALAPARNLVEAKANVETSAAILKNLLSRSKSEQTIISTLETQYKNFDSLIKKTDSLFTNASSDPRIKIANAPVDINTKRAQINTLLQSWNSNLETIKSLSKSNPSSVTLASLVAKAKEDLATINNFVSQLEVSVNNLTILNSNLTQAEIDAEKAKIEVVKTESEKATSVINSVEVVSKSLETSNVVSSDTSGSTSSTASGGSATSNTNTNTSASQSSGTGASTATTESTSSGTNTTTNLPVSSAPPIVTEADIAAATEAVKEAEKVLEEFQEASGNTSGSSGGGSSEAINTNSGVGSAEDDGNLDKWDAINTGGPELVEGANPIAP